MPQKMKFLLSLMRNTPKFSGCGYNAIPKNMYEYENTHKKPQFEKFEKGNTYQDQLLKYYKIKYKK